MAYVEGHPRDKLTKSLFGQMGFTLISGIALIGIMLFFSDDIKSDLSAVLTIVLVISGVMGIVLYKLNPLGWKKIFNRKEFDIFMEQEIKVIEKLEELDDSYFVLNDFSFELFHVEHLVVSKNGVFVIGKIRENGKLSISDNTLFAGEKSLETLTGRLWRLSHLVNLITKKGFGGAEIMPQPVIVLPDQPVSTIKKFNGIRIAGINELNSVIKEKLKFNIEQDLAESFAFFMRERYMVKR